MFGDLDDPESEVSRLSESPRGSKLLEDLGTRRKSPICKGRSTHERSPRIASPPTCFVRSAPVLAVLVVLGRVSRRRSSPPALFAWFFQMWRGFGITGIRWPVYWGFLITDFVFWIGISHAGTLISAILRLVNAGWRRPVTRCAEVITAFALMIGGLFPIIHLGKPWLFFWLVPYPNQRLIWPNFRSPLVWDFFAISTYLTGSLLFLFLPMIPDFALVRDRSTGLAQEDLRAARPRLARHDEAVASPRDGDADHGDRDHPGRGVGAHHRVVRLLDGAGADVALVDLRPLFRGRRDLQRHRRPDHRDGGAAHDSCTCSDYLQPIHFENLGKLLLTMSLLWGYFTFNERLTAWYGNGTAEIQHVPGHAERARSRRCSGRWCW